MSVASILFDGILNPSLAQSPELCGWLTLTGVVLEKVTVISDPRCGRNMLQGRSLVHAFLHFHSRRPAHHDGATLSFGSPVLLLPSGRSSSWKPSAAAHRQARQLQFCAGTTERQLQRNRTTLD